MWQNWPNQTALIRKWIWQGCLSVGVPRGKRETNKTERRSEAEREIKTFNEWPQDRWQQEEIKKVKGCRLLRGQLLLMKKRNWLYSPLETKTSELTVILGWLLYFIICSGLPWYKSRSDNTLGQPQRQQHQKTGKVSVDTVRLLSTRFFRFSYYECINSVGKHQGVLSCPLEHNSHL